MFKAFVNHVLLLQTFVCLFFVVRVSFQNSLYRFPEATESERQNVANLGAKDWETFLIHRAAELKTGQRQILARYIKKKYREFCVH
jgi:hypothetical protein